jgi:FkbM family methyltransferase
MTFSNIKNKFFKSTMNIIGNKGLGNNYIGKNVKSFLVKNSKNNQVIVNGCKMYLDKNDVMQISLFDYEPIETKIVKSNIKKNDIVVDIGSNIGYYTLLMAKLNSIVHSYEPELSNFKLLKKNIYENNFSSNVKLYNKAVSNFNGKSKLFLSEFTPGEHKLDYDRFGGKKFIEVDVTKINLDRIDFAKIDVEGSELHVLEGMKSLPNKILIEFNSLNLKESGSNYKDFFKFLNKYTIKEVSKNGLIEPDYDKLIENKLATNLFLS